MKQFLLNLIKKRVSPLRTISLERLIRFSQHFLIALAIDLLVLSIYHQATPHSKIITLDVTQLSKVYLKTLAKQSLTETESRKAVQSYATQLEITLQKIADDNHWIILPKEAVIQGAPDLTDEIQTILHQTLE
jgi:hypothetical protein